MRKILPIVSLLFITSCRLGNYDTGDGDNSYLNSSLGQIVTNADAMASALQLDNGSTLDLTELKEISGAKADTLYRGLIYYSSDGNRTELLGFTPSLVSNVMRKSDIRKFIQDPVDIESAWVSADGRYLNLTLLTRIGEISEGAQISLTLALDHRKKMTDGSYHYYLSLYHDQSTVPEYYTEKTYLSFNTQSSIFNLLRGDSVTIDFTDTKYQNSNIKLKVQ